MRNKRWQVMIELNVVLLNISESLPILCIGISWSLKHCIPLDKCVFVIISCAMHLWWIKRFFFFLALQWTKCILFTIWLQHVGVAVPDVTTAFLCPACSYHCMYWYTASGVISCIIKENFIVCVVLHLSPVWVYLT